ncbi:prefoldin subunit beta [Candidatus Woesearchaeota archaeon]|nr:prefoldin subunit beta [Candidatus Woesearchaeota archaeon]
MNQQEKITQLQVMEQNLTSIILQKQQLQAQLAETENALKELEKVDSAYRIVGNIMIKKEKQELIDELKKEKELLELRIKTLTSQEEKIKEKTKELQKEVLEEMKKGKK